jgi:hypothetical protein
MFKISAVFALFGFLGMFSTSLAAEDANSHFVVTTRFDDVWTADSASSKVKINLREIRVEAAGPYATPVTERVLVLFEPESGAFTWYVVGEDSIVTNTSRQARAIENECVVFLKDGSLVLFMGGGVLPKLYVRDFRGNAINMDDAEGKALMEAAQFHRPPSKKDEDLIWHSIVLTALGRDFVSPPDSVAGGPSPKVTGVKWDENKQHWKITLQARWIEEISLDADYDLVSMKKVE